ncbi:MAG: NifU family protein [bacterium]
MKKYSDDEKSILKVLEVLRPYLQRDGGDIEFIKYEDGFVYVKMLGACAACAGLDGTLYDGIESVLVEQVPGVIGVRLEMEEFEY